jgi:hypothetical protein
MRLPGVAESSRSLSRSIRWNAAGTDAFRLEIGPETEGVAGGEAVAPCGAKRIVNGPDTPEVVTCPDPDVRAMRYSRWVAPASAGMEMHPALAEGSTTIC